MLEHLVICCFPPLFFEKTYYGVYATTVLSLLAIISQEKVLKRIAINNGRQVQKKGAESQYSRFQLQLPFRNFASMLLYCTVAAYTRRPITIQNNYNHDHMRF